MVLYFFEFIKENIVNFGTSNIANKMVIKKFKKWIENFDYKGEEQYWRYNHYDILYGTKIFTQLFNTIKIKQRGYIPRGVHRIFFSI